MNGNESKLRVLHLEDDNGDAELIRALVMGEGLAGEINRVQSREAFAAGLEGRFDLILSDFMLPGFDGLSALRLARSKVPDVPFIFVSGTMGEDIAIESLRGGATDYVLKQNLRRLGPAIRRAMRETEERRDKKALQEKFIRAQKMEAVGLLAGGIAHDFNNLLTVILGHVQLLQMQKNADPELLESLKNIHHAAETAGGLTRQLLAFSRVQPPKRGAIDVNTVITGMANMLGRVIGQNIAMRTECSPELPPVWADAGMLEQVILNLAVNARDAMPKGGSLVIRSDRMTLDDAAAKSHAGARPGDFVRISVSDTGTGIPPEVLGRMFEPFFTTKEPGKGTGLGLATVYGIVEQHNGWIEVRSELGAGTEFIIYLPEHKEPAGQAGPAGKFGLKGGNETILVVDDDPSQRKLARIILEEWGYRILEAHSAKEALILWDEDPARVDLLLTDILLPEGFGGKELADKLAGERPELSIIYTSGYGNESVAKDASGRKTFFLQKPYQRQTLLRMVRTCLDLRGEKTGAAKSPRP